MTPIVITEAPATVTADLLRLVRLDETNSLIVLSDLESDWIRKLRDSFKIGLGARQPIMARAEQRRYAGAIMVAETSDNGTVGAQWLVRGSSRDDCLARLEDMLEQADQAAPALFLQWKPGGSTRSTLYELRGTPTAIEPTYSWPEFQTALMRIAVTWPVAPLASELPLNFWDDFRTRPGTAAMGDWTHTGSWVWGTANQGDARPPANTAAGESRVHNATRRMWTDGQVTVRGSAVTGDANDILTPGLKYDPVDGQFVYAVINGGALKVMHFDGATAIQRASAAVSVPAQGVTHWLRLTSEGDTITAEYFATEPGPVSTGTVVATWSGATVMGSARQGHPMLMAAPIPSGKVARFEEIRVAPYTYRLRSWPAEITLPAIGGNAPARCELEVTGSTGDAQPPRWALIAWRPHRAGDTSTALWPNVRKVTIIEADGADVKSGTPTPALTANAGARGGNVLRFASSTSVLSSSEATWGLDPTIFTADDFSTVAPVQLWARLKWGSGAGPWLVVPSWNPTGQLSQMGPRYTIEHGPTGLYLPDAATVGTGFKWVPLGTFMLPPDTPHSIDLRLAVFWGALVADNLDADYLQLVAADRSACGPTGKPRDSAYPNFCAANGYRRLVRSDLSGLIAQGAQSMRHFPAPAALGGAPLELAPGVNDLALKFSSEVPLDPTGPGGTIDEQLTHTATVTLNVTPRHRVVATA